jgi:tripartite-type tricarboxylate transporter receptor subunit TctC
MAVNKTLYRSIPFDSQKDFAPIIQISAFPLVLEVHPSVPANNIKEFLALAKSKSADLGFASAGNGTPQHLAGELFNTATGLKLQHIPYKGAGPALTDVMGGHVKVMFDILGSSVQYIKSGKLRPLAVTTATRSPALPDVPTLAESGLTGYNFSGWHGIVAPAATPKPVVAKLNQAINEIFADPEFRKRWEELGTPIVGGKPEAFGELIRSESAKLGKLVKDAGVTVD